jgi:hypothetical protein
LPEEDLREVVAKQTLNSFPDPLMEIVLLIAPPCTNPKCNITREVPNVRLSRDESIKVI